MVVDGISKADQLVKRGALLIAGGGALLLYQQAAKRGNSAGNDDHSAGNDGQLKYSDIPSLGWLLGEDRTDNGASEMHAPDRDQSLPRGIRNDNPGNIELGANWRGLSTNQTDGRFAQFDDPIYGIRALARVLSNYQALHGINTIRGVINRWAPGHENNTEAYVRAVARDTGISADAPLDLSREETVAAIVPAIIRHENGMQPYSQYQIDRGVSLGVV